MIEAYWWMSRRGHRRRKMGGIRAWCMERWARGLLLYRTCRIEGGDVIMKMTWPLIKRVGWVNLRATCEYSRVLVVQNSD